jgi:hypothetical protein
MPFAPPMANQSGQDEECDHRNANPGDGRKHRERWRGDEQREGRRDANGRTRQVTGTPGQPHVMHPLIVFENSDDTTKGNTPQRVSADVNRFEAKADNRARVFLAPENSGAFGKGCAGRASRYRRAMGKGKWTRWGRGSAEGYGFALGDILRYGVVRVRAIGGDRYEARLNEGMLLGSFATLGEAKAAVEAHARQEMAKAQADFAKMGRRAK